MPKRKVIALASLSILSLFLLTGCGLMGGQKNVGEAIMSSQEMLDIPAVDFEAIDLEGNKVKLSDYRGKIVFLNFWATWCPPCLEEMPLLQEIHERYQGQDVVILAVSPTTLQLRGGTDDREAERQVREFIKEHGYTFPVLLDQGDKVWKIYQQRGIPTNYVIDAHGVIRYGFMGPYHSIEHLEWFIETVGNLS